MEKQLKKPYPYTVEEQSLEELEVIKATSSCREYNVFHDYNYIIYNLASQLIKLKEREEDCRE